MKYLSMGHGEAEPVRGKPEAFVFRKRRHRLEKAEQCCTITCKVTAPCEQDDTIPTFQKRQLRYSKVKSHAHVSLLRSHRGRVLCG